MAKRLTDTDKWRDEWFGSLPNDYRMVWLYLIDSCSHAGIWKKDYRGMNFNCNTNLTESQVKEIFADRLIDCGNFFFIPKFLKFQYAAGLNSQKPVIVSVVNELSKNNLCAIVTESLGNDYLIIKDKSKDKDKRKRKDKSEEKPKTEKSFFDPRDYIPQSWPEDEFIVLFDKWVAVRVKKKSPVNDEVLKHRIVEFVEMFPEWNFAKQRIKDCGLEEWVSLVFTEERKKLNGHRAGRYAHEEKRIHNDKL